MPDYAQTEIAYERARWPTRCMVCGIPIGKGSTIATAVDNTRITFEKKSKAKWAHPPCLARALRENKTISAAQGRLAYKKRQLKKMRRASKPDS